MPIAEQPESSELLTRYLLGALSQEEAERLDERSIADDEFVLRLDAVENDLVDAFVRGELSGESLERFESVYLSTSRKAEKVEFAKAMLRFQERSAAAAVQQSGAKTPSGARRKASDDHATWSWLAVPRLELQWTFAAATLLMVFASAYLITKNEWLGRRERAAHEREVAAERRATDLERQLSDQRSASASAQKELEELRASVPVTESLKTITVLLLPPTRGAGQIPTVSVTPGTDRVTLRLQLEGDDFPSYQVALREPAVNRIIWSSPRLRARLEGQAKAISVSLSAGLLKQQNYIVELTGIPTRGSKELLTGYVFRVVLK